MRLTQTQPAEPGRVGRRPVGRMELLRFVDLAPDTVPISTTA